MSDSKRIAKNTLMLYFRQILIMLVSLYTVRVVLNVLGAEDYGIYNVVAGVVTMFSFLGNAMATASQRYFSFDLGKNDNEHLKTTFSVTFQIYILLALFVVLIAETLGIWFVNHKLVIPEERLTAANWIFQAAIISFLLTLITTPYMAAIIAHENMKVYAYVSIVEVILRFSIVFVLKIFPYDKMILYGLLLTIVSIIITFVYRLYCYKYYFECKVRFIKDYDLFKEIVTYSCWNLFGASVTVVKNQVMNVMLNLFFGPVVNAARGIAFQVNSAVVSFSHNFSTALRPQIIKAYSIKDEKTALDYVYAGSKATFFLMYIFFLPLNFEMDFVLTLWLKNVPEYTVLFTQLVLIDALIDCVGYPVMTLAHATGKIKMYQGVVGGIILLNLPVSYSLLKFGLEPHGVLIISIIITTIASIVRLFIVQRISIFSVWLYFKKVVVPCAVITIITCFVMFFIIDYLGYGWIKFFLVVLFSIIICSLTFFILGLTTKERLLLKNYMLKKLKR